jgi:hypothetical protein
VIVTETTDTTLEKLPWKELIYIFPIAASSFAFAYDIGYFSAFDIGWFSFFTLSDHAAFALRALPIAVGASVGFLIGLTLDWKSRVLAGLWIAALGAAAIAAFRFLHFAVGLSFVVMAIGAFVHHWKSRPDIPFANILYWIITMVIISFMAGFASANRWRMPRFEQRHSSIVVSETSTSAKPHLGNVFFAGSQGVLFYEIKPEKGMHMVVWKDIKEIRECLKNPERPDPDCVVLKEEALPAP